MNRLAIGIIVCAAALVALAGQAKGHAGHDENIRLIGSDESVQIRFVVEADQLLWFDSNRDGTLSRREFDQQVAAIGTYVDACLNARSADGTIVNSVLRDQPIAGYGYLGPEGAVERIRFIRAYDSKAQLATLDFACFPGSHAARQVIAVGTVSADQLALSESSTKLAIRSSRSAFRAGRR